MDLEMPVLNGIEATRRIAEQQPEARIVVLTTYAGDEDIHRALDAGAVGYLLKDMLAAEVLKVIRSVMAGRRGIPPTRSACSTRATV
jgi:DNA-binding NarL/FixJ family response regulator